MLYRESDTSQLQKLVLLYDFASSFVVNDKGKISHTSSRLVHNIDADVDINVNVWCRRQHQYCEHASITDIDPGVRMLRLILELNQVLF